jgi:glucokinase
VILAGDIGGTNTRLALVDPARGPRSPVAEARYPSGEFPGCEAIVERFLAAHPARVEVACFGVAGPVLGGRARITNLSWVVDADRLARHLDLAEVVVVNDLAATATAIPHLGPEDLHPLNRATAVPGGPIGVVAPGTGLGEAFLLWDGRRYVAHPSEGGHASFAPRNELEIELLRFLLRRFEHVSYERVCSGSGIPNLYDFFAHRHPGEVDHDHHARVLAADDPTPLVLRAALDEARPDRVSRRAVETFVSVLGSETGNLALKVLATGGMYLGGGMPLRVLPLLDSPLFTATYAHKGRFRDMVADIPVQVILEAGTALIGAAVIASAHLGG